MKLSIEQVEHYLEEMKRMQIEHPKAKVYYAVEDGEIRITYPLPRDYDPAIINEINER